MSVADVEARLQLITEAMSEVFWMTDAAMTRIEFVSPAFERIWGHTREELYRNPWTYFEAIHPEDRHKILETQQQLHGGSPFEHEYRIIGGDGGVRWIWDRGYPVRAADGSVRHYVGIAQDITERKQVTSDMGTLAERFRLVMKATNDGMWDWVVGEPLAWWSDAAYEQLRYDRSVAPTFEAWTARIHPEDRERVVTSFTEAVSGATQWSAEYRFLFPDGEIREMLSRAYMVLGPDGKPVRLVGVMMDLTEQRALERQLRQAQKMEAVGRLAGGIAHDFNNILQSAVLELSLLMKKPGVPPAALEHARAVRGAIDRAANLTHQLLVFSRREPMRVRAIDLNASVTELARMLRRLLGDDIVLELACDPRSLVVPADRSLLDQVLINLAINARDAMPGGGTLSITTSSVTLVESAERPAGTYARLTIRDTGMGIAPAILPRIFEPFFTTKESGRGTGLGLPTVHGIVEQHGGWIDVESEPGRGTTFSVYLPVGREVDAAPEVAAPAPDPRGRETILVVEDDAHVRGAMRAVLESAGYRIVEADSGHAALATWEREGDHIAAVVTDIVMPGNMNGSELASELVARRPSLKVILTTGHSSDLAIPEAGPHVALVHKPVAADKLLSVVRACLDA